MFNKVIDASFVNSRRFKIQDSLMLFTFHSREPISSLFPGLLNIKRSNNNYHNCYYDQEDEEPSVPTVICALPPPRSGIRPSFILAFEVAARTTVICVVVGLEWIPTLMTSGLLHSCLPFLTAVEVLCQCLAFLIRVPVRLISCLMCGRRNSQCWRRGFPFGHEGWFLLHRSCSDLSLT